MLLRLCSLLFAGLLAAGPTWAQVRVRTETIRRPAPTTNLPAETFTREPADETAANNTKAASPVEAPPAPPRTEGPNAALPAPVAQTRDRIITAARSGDLRKLLNVMQANPTMPIFSTRERENPVAYWKANYPDSEGIEILSILLTILEMPFVHVDAGTPQDAYVWPYFARLPLGRLEPPQQVELLRIVTGADYQEMRRYGKYSFYRVGIAPDGTWRYFVTGE